ncbi:Dynein_light domain-containing protein, partial [Cephalotus follicularis]
KALVGETDMPPKMPQDAIHTAAKALYFFEATKSTDIAKFIKENFDRANGSGWQCIVGTDFGSFVTHFHGCFIHFCIDNLAILLFRVAVNQAHEAHLFPTLKTLNCIKLCFSYYQILAFFFFLDFLYQINSD